MRKNNYRRKRLLTGILLASLIISEMGMTGRFGKLTENSAGIVKAASTDTDSLETKTSADGKWQYRCLADRKIVLTGFLSEEPVEELVIPGLVDGAEVTALDTYGAGKFIKDSSLLTTVTVPEGVIRIGDSLFADCTALQKVELSTTVKRIGASGFARCSSLTSIDLKNVEIIGYGAFFQCRSLTSVDLSKNVTKVGGYAFANCDRLETAVDSPKLTEYGDGVYMGAGLTSICLKASATKLPGDMFSGCNSLETVDITGMDDLEDIGDLTFIYCTKLKKINGLNRVHGKIGMAAFSGCKKLESFNEEEDGPLCVLNTDQIGDGAFMETDIQYLELHSSGNGVVNIGSNAFSGSNLINVTFEAPVKIGDSAFQKCSSLRRLINLEQYYQKSGYDSFEGTLWLNDRYNKGIAVVNNTIIAAKKKTQFEDLEISDGITEIADGAFRGNETIYSVTFPESLSRIGDDVFHGCSMLENVTFAGKNTAIGSGAFEDTPWLLSQEVDPDNGFLILEGTSLIKCATSVEGKIVIPRGVERIEEGAFSGCSKITGISFEGGSDLCYVGAAAFENCYNLEEIDFPENDIYLSVENLNTDKKSPFYNCSSLSSLTIPAGMVPSKELNAADFTFLFEDCKKMKKLTIHSRQFIPEGLRDEHVESYIEMIILGSEITDIPEYAFYYCDKLERLQFSKKLTTVEENAFSDECPYMQKSNGTDGCICAGEMLVMADAENLAQKMEGEDQWNLAIQGVTGIAAGALLNIKVEYTIRISVEITYIGSNAFRKGTIIVAETGSYGAKWAEENGYDWITPEELGMDYQPKPFGPDKPAVSSQPPEESPSIPPATDVPSKSPAAEYTPDPADTQTPTSSANAEDTPLPTGTQTPNASPATEYTPFPTDTQPSSAAATEKTISVKKLSVVNKKVKGKKAYVSALEVSWQKTEGQTSYQVYRAENKNGTYKCIKRVKKNSFVDQKVKKGKRYYYKIRLQKTFSKPVSAVVDRKLIRPVVSLASTDKYYVITLKKAEGRKYEFQLKMAGYNQGKWFSAERYRGSVKRRIVMKKNTGSTSEFSFRLRTVMKVNGKNTKSEWSKTIRYE